MSEPFTKLLIIGTAGRDQPPEILAVVHVPQVTQLVHHHIIYTFLLKADKLKINGYIAV